MSKAALTVFAILVATWATGQTNNSEKLVDLGKVYKDYMFRNEPAKDILKDIRRGVSSNLESAADFIAQTITTDNKLLTKQFLKRPDDQTLKQIFIIHEINLNLRNEKRVDNTKLIDSLNSKDIPPYELLDNYYGMLFTAVGNKNKPFDFSKEDFTLNEYGLRDETEKGILFLRCMRNCNSEIWGFMNIVKPPNTQRAYEFIKKYPRFNGRPYFQYTDFYFPDFEMVIIKDKGKQSYKSFFLDKYYETLLFHLICLRKEGGKEKERLDLILGSVLKDRDLYRYTSYKEVVEKLLVEQKKD